MPKSKDRDTQANTEPDSKLEIMLEQIAAGMLNLQATVGELTANLNKVKNIKMDDRSYITNWRELGGGNLTFYPNSKSHPMLFLKKLNKLLIEAGVPEERKVGLAAGCLRASAADWIAVKEPSLKDFEDFEQAFRNRFWGVENQRELFLEIRYGKFETGSRSEYFLNLINQARFLEEKISDKDLIEKISKHFSTEVRRGIITQGLDTIDTIEEYLRKIDETYDERVNDNGRFSGRNNFANNNNNTRNAGGNNNQNRNRENVAQNDRNSSGNQGRQNQNVNLITRFNQSQENILLESDYENEDSNEKAVVVPVVNAKIVDEKVEILIDSGSEVTAISNDFFEKIKSKIEAPVLPVTNVQISVAVGGKTQRIKYQTYLPITIGEVTFEVVCLVVPHLNRDMLIGCDFLSKNKASLNFEKWIFEINGEQGVVSTDFIYKVSYDKSLHVNICEEKNVCQVTTSNTVHKYNATDFRAAVDKSNLGNESDKAKLFQLLDDNGDLFSECPGRVNCYEHEITMRDEEPFYVRSYPVPYIYRGEVVKQIKEMLDWGIISMEKTEYVSPLVTVIKKDKSVRVCLDARRLNSKMGKDYIPPPNAFELLLNFKIGQVISTIDLTASYWQIVIKKEHRKYVGFLYEDQTYVFNVLPFGLTTSMASLIRCLKQVLGSECDNFTLCYVDDLLIFSDNIEKHFEHLSIIFNKLAKAGLTVKLRKSQFFRDKVIFLGHVISPYGISIDDNRIKAINKFPVPRGLRELRGFLGLVNYEQRFCRNYADLTIPLLKLLKKGVKWVWASEQDEAFAKIKKSYLEVTFLSHPNLGETFYVQCDSSDFGLGGCLYQINSKTNEKLVVAYTSRTLKTSELNYTVSEKETLAIVHCFRQWRTLILGRALVVVTDHKSLTFLLSCNLRSSRLMRWVIFLQEFDFEIVHCRGTDNVVADVLSRQPLRVTSEERPDSLNNVEVSVLSLSIDYNELRKNFKNIRQDQLNDNYFGDKINFLEFIERQVKILTQKELKLLKWYVLYNGVLFRRGTSENKGFKLCVPRQRRVELIKGQHADIGHFGKAKTYGHMKCKFYWPKMQKNIRQFVASCDICQKSKVSKSNVGLLNPIVVEKPGELVCLDLMGPLPKSRGGATMLLVIVDVFSKFVKLYTLKRATTVAILNRVINDYIPKVQKPKCILSDNGTQFTAKLWKERLNECNIRIKTTSVYFPQGNPTERYNREVGRLLRLLCHEKHTKWACVVQTVESWLNNVINESSGFTANFIQLGKTIPNPIEKIIKFPEDNSAISPALEHVWVLARQRLLSRAELRSAKANAKRNPTVFAVGDRILVRTHYQSSAEERLIRKFFLLYEGPYYVLRQAGPNSYIIGDEQGNELAKHNVVNLKLYRTPIVDCT